MNSREEWLSCPGYEGIYEVSSLGRVKRISLGKVNGVVGHIMKPGRDTKGYPIVCLSNGVKGTTKKIHRLVALAFLGDPRGLQVNHKDGNKSNNSLDNLEFVSGRDNALHAIKMGLWESQQLAAKCREIGKKITRTMAKHIRRRLAFGEKRKDLSIEYGLHVMTIGEIARNEIWPE